MDGAILRRLEACSGQDQLPLQWPAGRRIALYCHPRGQGTPVHLREYAELVYMARGSSHHRIGGVDVTLDTGELLLLGQNTPQELLPLEQDALAVSFVIKPEFFGDVLTYLGTEETPLREFILKCLSQESPYGYLHFHVAQVRPVQNLMENLLLCLLEQTGSRRAIPLFTVGLLFAHLLDETDRLTIGMKEQQAVLRVLQYIESNYADCSLNQVASMLHCDVTWLSREIRRRTGKTYTELLQERRLAQAAWLLRNTRQKISDIAVSVGYENVSYFHRIFAKQFGTSPKHYRSGGRPVAADNSF